MVGVFFVFMGLLLCGMCFYASILVQRLSDRRFLASFLMWFSLKNPERSGSNNSKGSNY